MYSNENFIPLHFYQHLRANSYSFFFFLFKEAETDTRNDPETPERLRVLGTSSRTRATTPKLLSAFGCKGPARGHAQRPRNS